MINENTNCRTGPSADYELVVTFLSGESAKIVSQTTDDSYVLVEDPNNPEQSCWLFTQYVTISGDLTGLPVATPPPPLVNFTMDFTRIQVCGSYFLEFKVVNTGTKTLQAYTIVAKDLISHSQQTTNPGWFLIFWMGVSYKKKSVISTPVRWVTSLQTTLAMTQVVIPLRQPLRSALTMI